MKRIVASVGLVAVGASGLQAASLATLGPEGAKPWSVAATLRGFYDDNVGTSPSGSDKVKAFGFEVSPSLGLDWALEQTSISLRYLYSFRYYDKRPPGNTEKYDQVHTFNALLNHAFNERYMVNLQDSFVIGQEPDVLRAGQTFNTFQRVPGDNIRNYGAIKLNGQLTRLFGLEVGYANTLFHYADRGGDELSPSLAGLLDRMEHAIHIDGRWQIQPETIGVLGYQYGQVDYTGNEAIGADLATFDVYQSDVRNNRSHYGYVGVDHVFLPNLTGSVRVGAKYYDYYNEPGHPTTVGPSAQASLQYTYAPESYVELGVTHDRNATDMFSAIDGNITTDAESTVVYGSLNHRIIPRLYGSILGQFQNSQLNGGALNNLEERYYLVGLNLQYRFNPHLSAHAGYNYDKLDSEVSNRSFDRNRIYLGVTASY
jgi:putative beta-barrel porin BBP2